MTSKLQRVKILPCAITYHLLRKGSFRKPIKSIPDGRRLLKNPFRVRPCKGPASHKSRALPLLRNAEARPPVFRIQSGAATSSEGFVKWFLRVPQLAIGRYCSCHAACPNQVTVNKQNSTKHFAKPSAPICTYARKSIPPSPHVTNEPSVPTQNS